MASDLAFLEAPLLPRTLRMSSSSTSSSGTSRLDEGHHDEYHSTYFLTAMHKSRELAEQISAALTISRGEKRGNDVEEERKFQQQVRRQGLVRGRKTSRFSMDPTTRSQEPENLKSFLKDKHIAADPEEYFATIKRNELAERELKKLKGELDENPINDDVQRTRRQRRPGLPQRRTSLKHFSSLYPETNNPGVLKPTIHKEYTSPGNYNNLANISQVLETTTSQLHNFAVAGADKENMGKNPVDTLLSTYDKLDDREGVALLQEYLQLKPIVLDKLHLPVTPPDTPDAQTASSRSTMSDVALTLLQKPVLQTDTLIDPYAWSDTLLSGKPSDSAKDGFFDDTSPHHIDIPRPNLPAGVMDDTSTSLRRESFERILKFPSSQHLSDSGTSIPPIKTGSGPTSKNETTPDDRAMNTSTCLTDKTTDGASDKTDCIIGVNSPTICCSKEKSDVMPLEPSIHNQLGERSEGLDCETTNPAEGEECHRTMDEDQMPAVDVNPSNAFMHMEDKMDKAMHEEPDQQQGMQFNFRSDVMPLEPSIHNQLGERSEGLNCEATNPAEGEESHRTMDQDQTASVDVNPSNAFVHMKDKMDKAMHEEPDRQQGMQFNFRSVDMQLEPSIHNQLVERSEGLDCEATNPAEGEECHRTVDQDQMAAVDVNPSNAFVHMKDKIDMVMHEEPDRQQGMQDQSSTAMDTTPVEAGCQENSSIAEEHNKQIASGEAKQKARRQLKQRISRGKSLAGGGTTWDCGLRRSTRMKFRPLEHWRGERLLYGRIHDSLATVIGVKCSSPGGSGLKVKSYVSDEYAELVELAALH